MPSQTDCTACGACCFSELPEYVQVFGVDHERMGERAADYTHFLGNKCYMRLESGRCAALRVDPVARRFTCAIYDVRPDACRGLEPDSPACRAEAHEKRERPLLAIESLLRGARAAGGGEPGGR